jgi:hypothetical protein
MLSDEEKKALYAKIVSGTTESNSTSAIGKGMDWAAGALGSALWSIPETVGYTAPRPVEEWRADNPVSGFATEILPAAIPVGGWELAIAKTPALATRLAAIGSKEWPIASRMAQEAVKWGGFGATEYGISQALAAAGGPEIYGQKPEGESVWNIPLAAGLGAAIPGVVGGVLKFAGSRAPSILKLFPDLDVTAAPTVRARQMFETMEKTPPGDAQMLMQHEVNNAIRDVKIEVPGAGMRYLDFPKDDPMGKISSWFKPIDKGSRNKVRETRMFTNSKSNGFGSQDAYEAEMVQAGLDPYKFPLEGQYFRSIAFKPIPTAGKVAKDVENTVAKNMDSMGDNWFVKREPNDGLYVMAKKYAGELGKGAPEDKWLMFKTDRPGKFVAGEQFTQDIEATSKRWFPTAMEEAPDMGMIGNDAKAYLDAFNLRNYEAIAKDAGSSSYKGILPKIAKLSPSFKAVQDIKQSEAVKTVQEALSKYFYPRMQQFRKNPRANYIVNFAQMVYDKAYAEATRSTTGTIAKTPNLFAAMWKPTIDKTKGSIKEAVDLLESSNNIENFWKVQKAEVPADEIATHEATRGFANPLLIKASKMLEEVNQKVITDINKMQAAKGETVTKWRPGHYGLSHIFEGDTRVILKEGSQVKAAVGGPNKKIAQDTAQEYLRQNPTWRPGETVSISKSQGKPTAAGLPMGLGPLSRDPDYLQPRGGLSGYKHELTPFNKDDLMKAYDAAMTARTRYQADMAVEHLLLPQMHALKKEDPAAYRAVWQRLQDMSGTQSRWSEIQNRAVDTVLAPVMGGNSASQISGQVQKSIYVWQLGSLTLGYPVVNMVSMLQTVAPELVYTLKAPAERLGRDYSFFQAQGNKGPGGVIANLNALKILGRSLPMMAKAPKELQEVFARLVEDRSMDPRAIESFVGQNSSLVTSMREELRKPNGFVKWIGSVMNLPAVMSEKFARTHAATVGYIAATDYLKMTNPDDVYLFTKQFVNRTQYAYSVADKPRVLTTPAGTMLGTFKNWMMHYMGSMANYAGEGFTHNNWSPLIWQTTSTAALGGVGATPLYYAADQASQWFTDKSLMQHMYDDWGDNADYVMYGVPAAIAGVSLYSQVKSPALASSPQQDATDMMNAVVWDRVVNAYQATKDATDYWWTTGENPAASPRLRLELARAFAPASVYRSMSALSDRIVSSKTNYPIIADVGYKDRVLYALGFHPVELDKAMAVQNTLYKKRETMMTAVNKYGLQYAEAMAQKDQATMKKVTRDCLTYGISLNSVMKSAQSQYAKMQKPALIRNYKYQDIAPYLNILGKEED